MSDNNYRDPMLEMFLFETNQLVEQLEHCALQSEKAGDITASINEVFRIMHTIKGSAAMMLYDGIAKLTHAVEDLFYYLREEKPRMVDISQIIDILLETNDFIKTEVRKIENRSAVDGDASPLIAGIREYLEYCKNANLSDPPVRVAASVSPEQQTVVSTGGYRYQAEILFEDECGMENIRAYGVVYNLQSIATAISHYPPDILDNDASASIIIKEGFTVEFSSHLGIEEIRSLVSETLFLKEMRLTALAEVEPLPGLTAKEGSMAAAEAAAAQASRAAGDLAVRPAAASLAGPAETKGKDEPRTALKPSMISVNVAKLDKLMDLVGELVIAEAMVTRNPELAGLNLESLHKASRQLRKITGELQDIAMAIRMVPLSTTFQKMNRLVRDMGRKLEKAVDLEISGEETEVDKNIIEHISDPLMHLIRNSIDHGVELPAERLAKGKPVHGKIALEARNAGGDVWISVRDDGKGLDRGKIYRKALAAGLTTKDESELSDREIFAFVLLPGFSTQEVVTEYSGRGVGLDVVTRNIGLIGGSVSVESAEGVGTTFSIRVPLTLAIVTGMNIRVGRAKYTLTISAIRESFKVKEGDVITDPQGNEMLLVRGQCLPVLRLHRHYQIATEVTKLEDGIIIMAEAKGQAVGLFVDELIGEQPVVIKALPQYVNKVKELAGCTILGDGGISLLLDVAGLINN